MQGRLLMKIYLVGGYVRDYIMNKEAHDKDFVIVGSSLKEMIDIGFKQVGKDFPVFLHPITTEEYALARTERKTGDKHTDFEFCFDKKTQQDSIHAEILEKIGNLNLAIASYKDVMKSDDKISDSVLVEKLIDLHEEINKLIEI